MGKFAVITAVIIVIILGAGFFISSHPTSKTPQSSSSPSPSTTSTPERTLINSVAYSCDKGKTVTAAYYQGLKTPTPTSGEPPKPTGSVDVSIGGAPVVTLSQTISADGARYANADESLVFWSKGNSALIMRNNTMDLDYTNCTVNSSPSTSASAKIGLPVNGPITTSGITVCLPHKDTSGPQTAECAIGLKDDLGRYFALSSSDPTKIGGLANGTHIKVSGAFSLRSDSKYQDVGVISVSSVDVQ